MKIAHECPLVIANEIEALTDYNYYIATIAKDIPSYLDHAINDTKFKILDCGTFEEGKPMPEEEYISFIEAIQPSEFIVPDYLLDKEATLTAATKWKLLISKYGIKSKPVGVVQGGNLKERAECYEALATLFDKIAIPYDIKPELSLTLPKRSNEYNLNPLPFDLPNQGRYEFVQYLVENNLFRFDKEHHFLGVDLPLEVSLYDRTVLASVQTIDTSSPVLHGLKGVEYNPNYGLLKKDKQMMKELITLSQVTLLELYLVKKNVEIFKDLVNR